MKVGMRKAIWRGWHAVRFQGYKGRHGLGQLPSPIRAIDVEIQITKQLSEMVISIWTPTFFSLPLGAGAGVFTFPFLGACKCKGTSM
jgi:hypothetical protein